MAGGQSQRMGRDKATMEVGGETLVARHLRQLRAVGVRYGVVVCNGRNMARIAANKVVQEGAGMSGAVRTGLRALGPVGCAWLVCVNDIITDSGYQQIVACELPEGIVIPTVRLNCVFDGGMLDVHSGRVRAIIEKPLGGCQPGADVNIMIHRVVGRQPVQALSVAADYEEGVNQLIQAGLEARSVTVDSWIALKTEHDVRRMHDAAF